MGISSKIIKFFVNIKLLIKRRSDSWKNVLERKHFSFFANRSMSGTTRVTGGVEPSSVTSDQLRFKD